MGNIALLVFTTTSTRDRIWKRRSMGAELSPIDSGISAAHTSATTTTSTSFAELHQLNSQRAARMHPTGIGASTAETWVPSYQRSGVMYPPHPPPPPTAYQNASAEAAEAEFSRLHPPWYVASLVDPLNSSRAMSRRSRPSHKAILPGISSATSRTRSRDSSADTAFIGALNQLSKKTRRHLIDGLIAGDANRFKSVDLSRLSNRPIQNRESNSRRRLSKSQNTLLKRAGDAILALRQEHPKLAAQLIAYQSAIYGAEFLAALKEVAPRLAARLMFDFAKCPTCGEDWINPPTGLEVNDWATDPSAGSDTGSRASASSHRDLNDDGLETPTGWSTPASTGSIVSQAGQGISHPPTCNPSRRRARMESGPASGSLDSERSRSSSRIGSDQRSWSESDYDWYAACGPPSPPWPVSRSRSGSPGGVPIV